MAWGSDDQNPSLAPSQTSGVNYAAQLNSAAYYNPLSGGSSSTGIAPVAGGGGQPSYAQRLSATAPAQPKQTTSQALAKSADRPQPAEASRAAREIQPWGGKGTRFEIAGNAASRGIDRVNSALVDIMQKAAADSPYNVQLFSGIRPGDPRQHGKGHAVDIALVDPYSGEPLANYQSPETFPQYETFARRAYEIAQRDYPELAENFRWGGYFAGKNAPRRKGGKYGATDLMHFDVNSGMGMAGGSFDGGLTDRQRRLVERSTNAGTTWAGLRPENAIPGPAPRGQREPLVAMNPPAPRARPAPAGFDTGRLDAATAYAPAPEATGAPFDAVMADVPTPRQRPQQRQQPPQARQASSSAPTSGGYTVQRGDTLAAIAQRELGDPNRWREIAEANGIRDPRRLMPGQQLVIPAAATRTVDIPQPRVRPRIASGPVGPTTARGVIEMGPRPRPGGAPDAGRVPDPRARPAPAMVQADDIDLMTETDAAGNYVLPQNVGGARPEGPVQFQSRIAGRPERPGALPAAPQQAPRAAAVEGTEQFGPGNRSGRVAFDSYRPREQYGPGNEVGRGRFDNVTAMRELERRMEADRLAQGSRDLAEEEGQRRAKMEAMTPPFRGNALGTGTYGDPSQYPPEAFRGMPQATSDLPIQDRFNEAFTPSPTGGVIMDLPAAAAGSDDVRGGRGNDRLSAVFGPPAYTAGNGVRIWIG